jgi:molecular chaperone GrpE
MHLCGGDRRVSKEETLHTENEDQVEQTTEAQATAEAVMSDQQSLAEQLAKAEAQAKEYLEGWQRARADYANYKKRVERELQESYQNASVDLLTKLFPILNDFERAMSNVPSELEGHTWLEGVMLIQKKFQKLLEENGVAVVDPTDEPFDPNFHEAVGTDEDTAVQSGYVTATLQKGYRVGDKVLRPALVRVAR